MRERGRKDREGGAGGGGGVGMKSSKCSCYINFVIFEQADQVMS